jgi:hypothetical protein
MLNGEPLEVDNEILRWMIPQVLYTPNDGYVGMDAFNWNASNGFDYASQTEYAIDVLAAAVAIEKNFMEDGMVIYPNPARSSITIGFKSNMVANLNSVVVTLINMTGQAITLSHQLQDDHHVIADISTFESGLYLVKISAGNRQMTKRIIISSTR